MKKNQTNNKFKLVKWKNKLAPTLFCSITSLLTPLTLATSGENSEIKTSSYDETKQIKNEKAIDNLYRELIQKIGSFRKSILVIEAKRNVNINSIQINDQDKFNEYTGKDLSRIKNIDKVKFSSQKVKNTIEVNIEIKGAPNDKKLLKYVIFWSELEYYWNQFHDLIFSNKSKSDLNKIKNGPIKIIKLGVNPSIMPNQIPNNIKISYKIVKNNQQGYLNIEVTLKKDNTELKKTINVVTQEFFLDFPSLSIEKFKELKTSDFNHLFTNKQNVLPSSFIKIETLKNNIFEIIKTKIQDIIQSLPDGLKQIALSKILPSLKNNISLQNDDKNGKLFIVLDTKLFEGQNEKIQIPIVGFKKLINTSKFISKSFKVIGTNGEGKMRMKTLSLFPLKKIKIEYAQIAKESDTIPKKDDYKDNLPTKLSNGDKIYIKFSIKDPTQYSFPSGFAKTIKFQVSNLKTNEQKKALEAIKSLGENDFNSIYDKTAKSKSVSNNANRNEKLDAIVQMIKEEITNNNPEAQKLITKNLITFPNSIPGTLKIEIDLLQLGEISKKIISIPGFLKTEQEKADKIIIDKEKDRIDNLQKHTLLTFLEKIDANSLNIEQIGITNKSQELTYKIINELVDNDKEIDVSIEITKGFQTVIATRKVRIRGINVSKANAAINEVKALFNKLTSSSSGTQTILSSKASTLPSELKSKTTANGIGFDNPLEKQGSNPKWVSVLFRIKNFDDAKGTLVVEVSISKTPGNKQKIEFILTGYQTQVKRIASNTEDIEKEKLRIERLDLAIINKLLSSINKNSLTKSELALGETPKGISYEIIHNKITREGEFDITLKIKKGSQEIETTRKVLISYMNKSKQKVSPPKVSPPKVSPPKVSPPKVSPPKVSPPKVSPPKVSPPKVSPPKVSPPKVSPPKVSPPKVSPPKVSPPKVSPPKVSPPKVSPPKVSPPKVSPPKVSPPKVSPPKVSPPKVSPPKVSPPKVYGLSKGVIAGIAIGASIFTLGLAFLIFRLLKSRI